MLVNASINMNDGVSMTAVQVQDSLQYTTAQRPRQRTLQAESATPNMLKAWHLHANLDIACHIPE